VSTQLIKPSHAQRLEVRCNVGDAIVANLAVHVVFFFERHLDTRALTRAFAHALTIFRSSRGDWPWTTAGCESDARAKVCLHVCVVRPHAP